MWHLPEHLYPHVTVNWGDSLVTQFVSRLLEQETHRVCLALELAMQSTTMQLEQEGKAGADNGEQEQHLVPLVLSVVMQESERLQQLRQDQHQLLENKSAEVEAAPEL